jgi:hypothetical protein
MISIPLNIPDFDYAAIAMMLLAPLGVVVAGALGLGLSFFGVRWLYRAFMRMASGGSHGNNESLNPNDSTHPRDLYYQARTVVHEMQLEERAIAFDNWREREAERNDRSRIPF